MPKRPPNILVITTDQHRFDALSARGHPHLQTPHFDHFLSQSLDFRSAYTQAPVCAPARYSLATGTYVPEHGVRFNNQDPARPITTIAHRFRDAGYRCFQAGHMHWSPGTTDTGYEPLVSRRDWLDQLPPEQAERFELEHREAAIRTTMGGPSPIPEEQFFGPYLARETGRFLREVADSGQPFFAWVSIYEPHPPFFPPAEVYRRFDPGALSIRKNPPETGAPLPEGLHNRRRKWEHLTDVEIKQMIRGYYGLVEVADRAFGQILQHLEDRGLDENTVVVWTSDHGEQLYDHRLFLKFCMFEESVHVPMAIRGPGIQPGSYSGWVEHVDLFPTLCAIADLEPGSGLDGCSLVPLFQEESRNVSLRDAVFSTIFQSHMVRTASEKCVTIQGEPVQFYDLEKDPGEFHNALQDSDCHERIAACLDRLRARFPEDFPPPS